MNEVEKMYKLANVKAKEYCDRDSDACMNCCPEWKNRKNCWKYKSEIPPFTAEKQIELIKKLGNININIDNGCYMSSEILEVEAHCDTFEETLAEFVNNLWQDLTEEERKQIKEILE